MNTPLPNSYHVGERLLAGGYPGSSDSDEAARRLRAFALHGVTLFVDLTHPADLLEPYDAHLADGARRVSHPIVDFGTTTIPHMTRILDDVDRARSEGDTVYVHCLGGVGRTGTVVGCWLRRHRLDDGDPIARIAELRRGVPGASAPSPEREAQREMVVTWRPGR